MVFVSTWYIRIITDVEKSHDVPFAFTRAPKERKERRAKGNVTRPANGKLFRTVDRKLFQIDKWSKSRTRSLTQLPCFS